MQYYIQRGARNVPKIKQNGGPVGFKIEQNRVKSQFKKQTEEMSLFRVDSQKSGAWRSAVSPLLKPKANSEI